MGGIGQDLGKLRQRVNALMNYKGHKSEVQNPLIHDESIINEIKQKREELESKKRLPEASVQNVYLDRVYTEQQWLNKQKLQSYINPEIHKLAEGIKYNGNILITDGNHRIALAKLNNQSSARMNIIDLDNVPKRRFWKGRKKK